MSSDNAAAPTAAVSPKVVCVTSDGEKIPVDIEALRLSHTFDTMYRDLGLEEHADFPGEFQVKNVEARVFNKVVEWCQEHKGQPDPVIEQDPNTRERKWFTFSDYEKKFFEVPVEELEELVMAANYLDVKSLYYYGCQSIAALIKGKSPDEIRALFGLEDDLTGEEKAEIRKQNPWCNY
ncbi:E3 ubiquitin ligase complex SCF subunit sconC [Aphelenchoides avenae]|nr:E3 ubiquitin ligase complex SCF subunit sconC [Aphelenchus avenae]